jgi:very-short-patch-repair endonuclease
MGAGEPAVLGSGGVASHRCAAGLHDLDGVPRGVVVEVSVPPGRNYRRHRSHRSSDLLPADRTTVAAIPVTTVTRTLIDLGAVLDEESVERAIECALRRGLTSPQYMGRRLDALSRLGRPGIGVARRLLRRRQPVVTGSDLEVRFLQLLRRAGLPEPVGQYCIGPYRVDSAYPNERRFIELDGVENHAGAAALQRDLERQNWLVGKGWVPLRFTWTDVMHHGQEVAAAVAGLTG